jgi:2-polyprenyl-3-methyl-5-hydroxy-6-metoxy-1,4-benzoquinol methylase
MKKDNKKSSEEIEFTSGERLYAPYEKLKDDAMGGVREHLDRYNFALQFLSGQEVVVDAACGSGYGSEILSKKAKKVVGLEISDHALSYAKKHHWRPNIEFQKADLNQKIELPNAFCNVIVSFETLEHLTNQEMILSEFRRILKPGGMLVISTPDRNLISGGLKSDNPFHLKELTKEEFISLLGKFFVLEEFYGQGEVKELPWWKKIIKSLRTITILRKAKQLVVKKLRLEKVVHKHFAAEEYTPIRKTDPKEPNRFYVMIAICKNDKNPRR